MANLEIIYPLHFGIFSLYTRPLSHPVSAITGSTRSAEANLHSPMGGGPTVISPNKLPPFKIGNNLETFSNLVTKYNHGASTLSIATVGKTKQRGTVRRAMSVRSRGSDVRKKYNRYCLYLIVLNIDFSYI